MAQASAATIETKIHSRRILAVSHTHPSLGASDNKTGARER
ncbi:hypothetical protein DB30_05051 [Enhygromyxa salina]|uniref:Uncharacterized protein n=1 Tax=Enhygromyxa salina TaxID=215803 RepID=A0A0C2D7J4_9BACT|nr:hypothetical protein DB30_05051 [Enhygromyxa salina]